MGRIRVSNDRRRESRIMLWILFSCSPPDINVFGQMQTENSVQIDWKEMLYRPESVNWFDTWTSIEPNNPTHVLGSEPTLLAAASLNPEPYVHFFTDAQAIIHNEQSLDDIIEPISCPIPSFGQHDIFITYIIIETEIFAMDCLVD